MIVESLVLALLAGRPCSEPLHFVRTVIQVPVDSRLPLIPSPKQGTMLSKRLEIGAKFTYPVGVFMHAGDFSDLFGKRFNLAALAGPDVLFDGGITKMDLPKEGFEIRLSEKGIRVFGQDETGLEIGLRRLATQAFGKEGHLLLPYGIITDWPTAPWRGVEVTGVQDFGFLREICSRVLIPLGITHLILDCSQVHWPSATSGIPPSDVKAFAAWCRSVGIDLIPSLALLGTGQGAALLTEALELTKAKSVVVGGENLDESGDWTPKITEIQTVLEAHDATMMVLGDGFLAASEGGKLANDVTAIHRRAALPQRAWVIDHKPFAGSRFPGEFPSVDKWREFTLRPIEAAPPEARAVRNAAIVATQKKCGLLTSIDLGSPALFEQLASLVVEGEYGWSARQDDLTDLGYDYRAVLRDLLFKDPEVITPLEGVSLSDQPQAKPREVGPYRFFEGAPVGKVAIPTGQRSKNVVVFVRLVGAEDPGKVVGALTATTAKGKVQTALKMGWNVAGAGKDEDPGYCPASEHAAGVFAIRMAADAPIVAISVAQEPSAKASVQVVGLDIETGQP